jgi:hypothetical protein
MLDQLAFLNNSKYFAGISMLLLNLGSRYIAMELSYSQEQLLSNKIIRRLLVFTVVFVATRDIWVSFVLTAVFIVLVSGIFNENSGYCILPKSKIFKQISKNDFEKAQQIIKLYQLQNAQS